MRKGGSTPHFLPPSGDGVKKVPGAVRVKNAMPVRQATKMDLAAGAGAKETCPGYWSDQKGASRQAARRGGMASASLMRPLASSQLFPLSG